MMIRYASLFVLFSCFAFEICCAKQEKSIQQQIVPEQPPHLDQMFNVRVLLAESPLKEGFEWEIVSSSGFLLFDQEDPTVCEELNEKKIRLTLKQGKLAINNRRLACRSVEIAPRKGHVSFNGQEYDGSFLFMRVQEAIALINSVDLEDYLFSVLRWESWPGWPLEVNRAFAIMCRTYVVNRVLQERAKKRPFDIKSTNIHQTYKGKHKFANLRQALHDTHGLILAYDGKPIVAMYDSCCGGVVPAHMDGVDFKKAPYLKRDYACTYCKKSKLYAWCVEYQLSDFEDLIDVGVKNAVPIQDVRISQTDKAGAVHEVIVKTNSAEFALTGKRIYSLLKEIKSLSFTVKKKGKKIIFWGNGFGHHLGLCQWGARQMVHEGWHYKDILRFFYPGVTFMKVEVV